MNMNTKSAFLKEMGITEWTSRDSVASDSDQQMIAEELSVNPVVAQQSSGIWWFYGSKPQGDAELLFQSMIRALGLGPQDWSWKNPSEPIDLDQLPQDGMPIVALAFGGPAAQKLSGERDALPQLRETILAMNAEGAEELPLIATFELGQLVSRPKDKALLWQDLLLAKSVLQNL